jgi:hypothetical protein
MDSPWWCLPVSLLSKSWWTGMSAKEWYFSCANEDGNLIGVLLFIPSLSTTHPSDSRRPWNMILFPEEG